MSNLNNAHESARRQVRPNTGAATSGVRRPKQIKIETGI